MGFVCQRNRFSRLLKKVDNGGASQTKSVRLHALLKADLSAIEKYHGFETLSETRCPHALKAAQVEKQEFLPKREELGEQAVTRKRMIGIGQQVLVALEAHLKKRLIRRPNNRIALHIFVKRSKEDL